MYLIIGKHDELQQLLGEITTVNLMSLMGDNGAQLKQRQKERQQKREERKAQGISDDEIAKLEAEEDAQAEQETLQKSTGNTLQDLEVYTGNFVVFCTTRQLLNFNCVFQKKGCLSVCLFVNL